MSLGDDCKTRVEHSIVQELGQNLILDPDIKINNAFSDLEVDDFGFQSLLKTQVHDWPQLPGVFWNHAYFWSSSRSRLPGSRN